MTRITDYFSNAHIAQLADHLPNLEELVVDGYGITDHSLAKLSQLPYLKSLTFGGLSSFTSNGLLDFITQLSDGNQHLVLSVERATSDAALTETEQDVVREAIIAKVNGRFEYQLQQGKEGHHLH